MDRDQRDRPFPRLKPLLYAITDGAGAAALTALLTSGVDLVQIREPGLSAAQVLALGLGAAASPARAARVLVNDRLDIALAASLDGVHLPANGLPADAIRPHTPSGFLLARSCHSVADVARALAEGVDFCVFGPIFATPSKAAFGPPLGLGALAEAARLGLPVLALGGITPENVPACLAAGAAGVAGIRLFTGNPAATVEQIRAAGRTIRV